MGPPCRVGVVPDLDRNEDFLRTFPGGWCLAFAMGPPISGRVALFCALDRNEGFLHSSILSFSRWGHPAGRVCGFPHSIVTKPALVSCLVFLQDGVSLSGLDL